jgi:hypothetical protein
MTPRVPTTSRSIPPTKRLAVRTVAQMPTSDPSSSVAGSELRQEAGNGRSPRFLGDSGSYFFHMVRLAGALSNPDDRLTRVGELRTRLLRKAANVSAPHRVLRPRCGAVQEAVVRVLGVAPEAMRVGDVHRAVERLLETPVSRDTINSCLSVGAGATEGRFERVKVGWYRLRS